MGIAVVDVICPTCGKPYQVRKFCNTKVEGDQFAAYVQANTRSCPTCYHSMLNHEAYTTAQELGLPPLVGTQAQIRWALTIRHRYITELLSTTSGYIDNICRTLLHHTDAEWWIRHRDTWQALPITPGKVYYMQDQANALPCPFDDCDEVID